MSQPCIPTWSPTRGSPGQGGAQGGALTLSPSSRRSHEVTQEGGTAPAPAVATAATPGNDPRARPGGIGMVPGPQIGSVGQNSQLGSSPAQPHNPGKWRDTVGVTWGSPPIPWGCQGGGAGVSQARDVPRDVPKAPRPTARFPPHLWKWQKCWESCHLPGDARARPGGPGVGTERGRGGGTRGLGGGWHRCCSTLFCFSRSGLLAMGNLIKVLGKDLENCPHFFLDFESKSHEQGGHGEGARGCHRGCCAEDGDRHSVPEQPRVLRCFGALKKSAKWGRRAGDAPSLKEWGRCRG